MALDEATAALVAQLTDLGARPLHDMSPAEARAYLAAVEPGPGPLPPMAKVTNRLVRVTGGVVPVRLLVPSEHPRAVILWYHGGGWVVGSIEDRELLGRRLAERTGCAVVLVGYRLAPEYRFPTAVDDSYAALRWVDRHVADIAGRRVPIIVGGDSAGGNLAAVTAIRARDRTGPAIDLQVLVCPVTDCDVDSTSYLDPDNALILRRETMIWFWDHYAPDVAARNHPDASPLRVPDTSGLPPAVVITAEHDVLRAEAEIYATRMVKSGVPVQHRRFPGQLHNFVTRIGVLPGSDAGIDYIVDAIDRQLARAEGRVTAGV